MKVFFECTLKLFGLILVNCCVIGHLPIQYYAFYLTICRLSDFTYEEFFLLCLQI